MLFQDTIHFAEYLTDLFTGYTGCKKYNSENLEILSTYFCLELTLNIFCFNSKEYSFA